LEILKIDRESERNRAKIERKEKGTVVFKNILVGSKKVAKNFNLLKNNGVVAVLNITDSLKNFHENSPTFSYLRIPIADSNDAPIENFFIEAVEFIEHHIQKGKVLVHCNEGLSRSPALVIAFAMKHFKMNLKEAYEKIIEKLEEENINNGFKTKLMDLDEQLFSSRSFDFFNKTRKRNSLKALASPKKKRLQINSKEFSENSEPTVGDKEISENPEPTVGESETQNSEKQKKQVKTDTTATEHVPHDSDHMELDSNRSTCL